MIADDYFAGAGGWDLAARELGIEARGIEKMPEAVATRTAAGLSTIHADVWTYVPDGRAELGIASPPCQTFSKAGKGDGAKALADVLRGIRDGYVEDLDHLRFLGLEVGDERTALVLTPLHFARHYSALAWEQVPAVLPVWEACAAYLQARGWHTWTGMLHAEAYGVPQTRKRAVLLASRTRPVAPPKATHSRYYSRSPEVLDPDVKPWISMAEGLGWGLTRRPSYTVMGGHGESGTGAEWGSAKVRASLRTAQQDPDSWAWKRPATTVVGSFCPDVIAAPGYRTTTSRQDAAGSIRVSVAEAGVLQSFPAAYPWQGSKTKQYLQAGNAIPPLLAGVALEAALTGVRP